MRLTKIVLGVHWLSKRREGLQAGVFGVPSGERQESAFAVAVHEDEAVIRFAFGMPAAQLKSCDGGGHSVAEVGSGVEFRAFDDLPLQAPEDDVAGCWN